MIIVRLGNNPAVVTSRAKHSLDNGVRLDIVTAFNDICCNVDILIKGRTHTHTHTDRHAHEYTRRAYAYGLFLASETCAVCAAVGCTCARTVTRQTQCALSPVDATPVCVCGRARIALVNVSARAHERTSRIFARIRCVVAGRLARTHAICSRRRDARNESGSMGGRTTRRMGCNSVLLNRFHVTLKTDFRFIKVIR